MAALTAWALTVLPVFTSPASAEDEFSLGIRANALGGTGEPTNDTLGFGLFGLTLGVVKSF